ncbi:hypothetical protein SAMN04488004_114101 [Loktanella salsilacus]|uniref:Uncharacterized protein n=1 Tax=Loktanella salsilacus TaxID=195913 RepID=A0A1I4GV33_9RHOB|nr:hypothetical protein SAMN04488004_114101 [Loktanella salsilacus]
MTHTLTLTAIAPVTHDTWHLTFDHPAGFQFEPGQATHWALESDSKLTAPSQSLARCRVTRLMCAMRIQASALAMDFSQSFDRRRHRFSQAKVRSTTHRRGSTSKPSAVSERLTIWTVHRPRAFSASRSLGPAYPPSANTCRNDG